VPEPEPGADRRRGSVRVVSYNLHKCADDRGALEAVLRALRPDVLLAQEAPAGFRWRPRCAELARRIGLTYVCGGGGEAAGNMVAVSLRCDVRATFVAPLPTPRFVQGRGMAGAVVDGAGVRFAVVATHLDLDARRRVVHVDRIVERAQAFAEMYSVPLLVGADTNETPGAPSWAAMTAAGLADRGVDQAADRTWTTPTVGPDRRIDVLLSSPGLTVRRYATGLDALAGPTPGITAATFTAASDHLPVLVEVSVSSAA